VNLSGKAAILTGAAKGVGAEIARRFRQSGARVLITYLNSEKEAKKLGQEGIDIMRADVTSQRDAQKIVETAKARFGRLDILINTASASIKDSYDLDIEEMNPGDFDYIYRVDVMGMFLVTRFAMPMLRKSRGCVINFSSSAALQGDSSSLLYGPAKCAVDGFTRGLARKVAPDVRVNAIAPGSLNAGNWIEDWKLKPQDLKEFAEGTPLQRLGEAKDIASVALFLASEDSAYITGQTLIVDGGYYSK
jgi:NAD(P)-dependent dehydrogenase (short-subunit alcohol dehydrogenase family)